MRFLIITLMAISLVLPGYATAWTDIHRWQWCLNILGFDPGPVDGIYGPQTKRALATYIYVQWGQFGQFPTSEEIVAVMVPACIEAAKPSPLPLHSW